VALIYLSFVGVIVIDAANCNGMFCDVGVGLATLPLGLLVNYGYDHTILFWGLIFTNTIIFYAIFAALQKWVKSASRSGGGFKK